MVMVRSKFLVLLVIGFLFGIDMQASDNKENEKTSAMDIFISKRHLYSPEDLGFLKEQIAIAQQTTNFQTKEHAKKIVSHLMRKKVFFSKYEDQVCYIPSWEEILEKNEVSKLSYSVLNDLNDRNKENNSTQSSDSEDDELASINQNTNHTKN